MADKNITDLSSFDFGFSVVDADELEAVKTVKQEVEQVSSTSSECLQVRGEPSDLAQKLEKSFVDCCCS